MLANFPRFSLSLVLALGLGLLTACAGLTPYKAEVVQGNVITREQAALIQPGMSRAQVRDILGSPMVADIFHEDRWDYVFTIRRAGVPAQQRNVVARFEGDRLKSLEAPELPTEKDFVALIDTVKPAKKVPVLALSPDQIKALPAPAAMPSPVAQVPQGANRTYPPLESR
jgi:outer membrane protein assembly factor BamE